MNHDPKQFSLADLLLESQKTISWPENVALESIPDELTNELFSTGALDLPFVGKFTLVDGNVVFRLDPALAVALNVSHETFPVLTVESEGRIVSENSPVSGVTADPQAMEAAGPDALKIEPVLPAIELIRPPSIGPAIETTPKAPSDHAMSKGTLDHKQTEYKRSRTPARHGKKRGSSNSALLIVAGLALAAVAVILLKPYVFSPTPVAQEQEFTVVPDSSAETIPSDSSNAIPTDSSSIALGETSDLPPETKSSIPNATADSNKTFTSETKGYTIIVRSALNTTAAETVRQELAALNFPMGILTGESDGVIRYRMGLGVFSTSLIADSVRISLGSQLPQGSWVTRIR